MAIEFCFPLVIGYWIHNAIFTLVWSLQEQGLTRIDKDKKKMGISL